MEHPLVSDVPLRSSGNPTPEGRTFLWEDDIRAAADERPRARELLAPPSKEGQGVGERWSMREAVTSVRGTVGEGSLTALRAPGRYAYLC